MFPIQQHNRLITRLFIVLTVPVFFILYLFTLVLVMLALPFAYLGRRSWLIWLTVFWARASFLLMGKRLKVLGREHVDKKQRYILVANHASLFDILAIM